MKKYFDGDYNKDFEKYLGNFIYTDILTFLNNYDRKYFSLPDSNNILCDLFLKNFPNYKLEQVETAVKTLIEDKMVIVLTYEDFFLKKHDNKNYDYPNTFLSNKGNFYLEAITNIDDDLKEWSK